MKKILILALGLLAFTGIAYAATVPSEPAIFDSVLSAPLSSGGTVIYLQSPTTTQNTALSGYNCFTIDVDTTNLEYACGTVSGNQVTGLTRNIDFFTGTTTNNNVATPSHRTGADIRITDFPFSQIVHNIFAGLDTLPAILHYTSGTSLNAGDSYALADVGYVNSVAIAGAPNASLSQQGLLQLGTQIQVASSTATGSTGAPLSIPTSMATSTPGSAGLWALISLNDGKLSPNWLNGTSENYVFNGLDTFNGGTITTASSTITATTTATADTIGYNPQINLTASTTITGFTTPQPVFIATSTGAVILSSANTYGASNFTGFAITNAVNGGTVVVQTGGVVKGFTGLTPGSDYYVQNSAGTIGTSIPVPEIYVGTAVSSTQILIQQRSMQYIGSGSLSGSPATSTVPAFTRYVVVSGTVGSQNGDVGQISGTLGMNAGASNPSVTGGAFTCCSLAGLTYTVTWNTSGTYAGTVVSSKSVSGGDSGSGSATLWYYR